DGGVEFGGEFSIEGVVHLGAVQHDGRDGAVPLDHQLAGCGRLGGHGSSSSRLHSEMLLPKSRYASMWLSFPLCSRLPPPPSPVRCSARSRPSVTPGPG